MDASTVGQTYTTEELFGPVQTKSAYSTEELFPVSAKTTEELFPTLVAEKPDQATIDRMRQAEQPERQSFLKTLGQETIDKLGGLGETILSAGSAVAGFPLGVASGAGKLAYDIWKGGGQGADVPAAKEFGENVTEKAIYQPKTSFGQSTTQALAAPFTVAQEGIRAGAKAITDDPQAQAAIGLAGDAALAFLIPKLAKLTRDAGTAVSTKIYEDSIRQVVKKGLETKHSPEVMKVVENAIRENVTPGTILEEVKRNVGTRRAEVKEAMPKLAEPIEAKAPVVEPIAEVPAPPKEGFVRLFRGEDSSPDMAKARPLGELSGRFWTKDILEAESYGDRIWYLDVPKDKVGAGHGPFLDETFTGRERAKILEPGYYDLGETDAIRQKRFNEREALPSPPKAKRVEIKPDGTTIITYAETSGPVAEVAQMPPNLAAERAVATTEPKIEGGGYTPTGKIVPPQEGSRLRGIAEDKARWEREHEGTRKYGSLQTFMEMPIEETKASADYGVAEAKQALAERLAAGETLSAQQPAPPTGKSPSLKTARGFMETEKGARTLIGYLERQLQEYEAKQALAKGKPSGIPEAKPKPKAVWPPKGEKPRARDRSEMTGLEAWKYDDKMGGLPRKEYEPPRMPRPTKEQSFNREVRRHYSRAFEQGEISWDKLTPDEVALLEKSFAPEEIAAFKARPPVEVLPEFTEADAIAKAEAERVKKELATPKKPSFVMPERTKEAKAPTTKLTQEQMLQINDAVEKNTAGKGVPRKWRDFDDESTWEANRQALKEYLIENYKANSVEMQKKGLDPVRLQSAVNRLKGFFQGGENLTRKTREAKFKTGQPETEETPTGTIEREVAAGEERGEVGTVGKKPIGEQEVRVEADAETRLAQRKLMVKDIIAYEYARSIKDPTERAAFEALSKESRSLSQRQKAEFLKEQGIGLGKDTIPKYEARWARDLQEHGRVHKDAIKKAMDELTGDEFDKASSELADKMEKDLGPVKGPKIGLTVEMAHPIPEPPKGGEKFKFPEATEARYEASKSLVKPTVIQNVNDFLTDAYHGMTRVYQDLPRGPEWVEVVQTLKNNEKQPGIISDKLNRTYKSMYYKLNRDSYDLATRKAIVADLLHEADAGRDLPFGFNEKSLRDVSKKLDEFTKDNAPVNDALKKRSDVWEGIRKDYIYWREKAGHDVEDILTKPDYFRHKVLETARSEYNKVAPGKKLRLRTGQDFLKKRGGSEKDILSDLVSADYEVMSRMLRDIADAKALVKIREVADKSAQFRAEAKKEGVPIEEVIPDEYTKWQPKEGHLMYVADTLPTKIAEKIMTDELNDIGVVKDKLRKSLAMGRERETWIIKKELAATLDKLGAQKEAAVMGSVFKNILTKWKQWTLLAPRRSPKYNLRNATGDADHVFVGSPGVFKYAPRSFKSLWGTYVGDRPLTGELKEHAERGLLQTTLQAQDIGEIKKLPIYRNLYKPNVLDDINIFKKYWRFVNNATNYREAILRHAAYLKYLDDMQKSPTGRPKDFGASFPEEIMALSDIRDRAARLSNELLGPYDEVSPIGVEISSKIYPFWRWKEVNAKFYARVIKNIAHNDEAAVKTAKSVLGGARIAASVGTRTLIGAGRFALKAMGLTALLTAWNNVVMEDEEKDLPEDVRNRLHITLGRNKDGTVNAFTRLGALGDWLEWFGMDNAYGHMTDYLNGRKTLKEIVTDMVKSPVNIITSGISPFIKAPLETLTRRTLFPDAFDPKVIRDRGSFLARQVGLEDEYKAIVGKPGKPYLSTLSQMAVYKYDPLETAYYDFLDIKRDYFKSIGRGGGGAYLSPSSNALYNMKLAFRWGEHKLVNKYMDEYANIVATQHRDAKPGELKNLVVKGIRQSLTSLHPLWGIKQDDWADYVKSLDPEAKDTLAKALRFYSDVLLGKSQYNEKEND